MRNLTRPALTICMLSMTACTTPQAFAQMPASYTATDIGDLAHGDTLGTRINNSGVIIGDARGVNGGNSRNPFKWDGTALTNFMFNSSYSWQGVQYDGTASWLTGINASGQIVGFTSSSIGLDTITITGSTVSDPVPTNSSRSRSYFVDVNDNGTIAGNFWVPPTGTSHPFLYNGTLTDISSSCPTNTYLTSINNANEVVGFDNGSANSSFLYYSGSTYSLPKLTGASYSYGSQINQIGDIAGYCYGSSSYSSRSCLWRAEIQNGTTILRVRDLGSLGGTISKAEGLNVHDEVVGTSTTTSNAAYCGFIYLDGIMHNLNSYTTLPTGWQITEATSINDKGEIVAIAHNYSVNGDAKTFKLTPVF